MRQYELTYLISDNVPEADLNKVTGKVGGYVKDCGGELLKEEIWGRRKLAYPIGKLEFATYVTLNFNLPSDKAKEFEHNIVMTGKIVRHLIIVKDFGTEELTLTSEDIAETKEIKEVIGGEKSFEVIEGETEESKDLMSVRSDKDAASAEGEAGTPAPQKGPLGGASEGMRGEEEIEKEETPAIIEEDAKSSTKIVEKEAKKKPAEKNIEIETEKPKKDAASIEGGAGTPASEGMRGKVAPLKKAKKDENTEADRLSKLDKELDDILGEEL